MNVEGISFALETDATLDATLETDATAAKDQKQNASYCSLSPLHSFAGDEITSWEHSSEATERWMARASMRPPHLMSYPPKISMADA